MMGKMEMDLLIKGGTIFCGKNLPEDYDIVAIKDNRIANLGYAGEEKAWIGKNTEIISLRKENLVIPGLHDHHIHLVQAGMLDKYIDLSGASSQEEAAAMTAEFAEKISEEVWIIGFGWSRLGWKDKALPVKESLDRLIPDRPVFLLDSELHGAWVNSRALEMCGINETTGAPMFGEIAKNSKGEPSGYLYETALSLVGKYAFDFSDSMAENLICRYMNNAVKFGITSVSDMTPYLGLDLAYEETYYQMDREGKLKIRINAARNLFEDIETVLSIGKKAECSGSGMYRVPYMKQFLDGVLANHTAMLLKPYCDKPEFCGGALLDLKELNKAVKRAHENGISVRLHACGDGAVHAALDAYEAATKECGKSKARHQIEHIECIDPFDIERFAELGVVASVQPEHIISGMPGFEDNCYPELLGAERDAWTWPFRTMLDQGAILAAGSDAPVVEGNPFYGMYCGMERIHPDGTPAGGWNPKEKLDIIELLHAYTWGAAYAEGREKELGTIETGKLADITIADRNLLNSKAQEVKDTEVLYTIVDGKVVYRKG